MSKLLTNINMNIITSINMNIITSINMNMVDIRSMQNIVHLEERMMKTNLVNSYNRRIKNKLD